MRTAIVSDLHLATGHGEDLLRDEGVRRLLLERLADADRLVLLGDAVELRESPLPHALAATRSFFEDVGRAMAGREVILVPGNHDHRLADPLVEAVALGTGGTLGLEHRAGPSADAATRIAGWLGEAELSIAYPGVWLRDDVYATHGHYMDCHMSLPRVECIAAAAVGRFFGAVPEQAAPADYERVLQPIYGLSDGLVQTGVGRSDAVRRTRPSELAWQAVVERGRSRSPVRRAATRAAVAGGVPAAVWTINRVLGTEFDPDLSAAAITRSGIEGTIEMARRLQLDPAHLITGHTHRAGPNPNDGPWRLAGGGSLHNTGSWVFATAFHHPGTPPGPYWPGTVTWVEDEGPPYRVSLLRDVPGDELRAIVARQRAAG